MYHVIVYEDSTHFEPYTSQYKNLKKGELGSLVVRMKHMKNNIMADGLVTAVVLQFSEIPYNTLKNVILW